MSNFERYDEEFQHINGTIVRKIKQLPNFAGERKKVAIRETEKEIEEAEQILRHMENECNKHPNKTNLQPKLKQYQGELTKQKKELQKAVTAVSNSTARDDLFSGAAADSQVQFLDQRSNLLNSTAKINQTSDRLQNAHRIALQSEQIGTNVLTDLHGQRQQLLNANEKLSVVDDHMKRGRVILTGMARRVVTNKLILAMIIVVLLGTICLIIYLKWLKPKN